ncbi:MAG: hypothetical protein K0U79_09895 [Gammaproteobacteria bacterium]|nr:hypothetical protein [Gammaproteobacteria bacterium]
MNRKVLIMDDAGNVVTIEEINLQAVNYEPADQQWFDLAWENAVEDKLVNEEGRATYKLSFA